LNNPNLEIKEEKGAGYKDFVKTSAN